MVLALDFGFIVKDRDGESIVTATKVMAVEKDETSNELTRMMAGFMAELVMVWLPRFDGCRYDWQWRIKIFRINYHINHFSLLAALALHTFYFIHFLPL